MTSKEDIYTKKSPILILQKSWVVNLCPFYRMVKAWIRLGHPSDFGDIMKFGGNIKNKGIFLFLSVYYHLKMQQLHKGHREGLGPHFLPLWLWQGMNPMILLIRRLLFSKSNSQRSVKPRTQMLMSTPLAGRLIYEETTSGRQSKYSDTSLP